MSGCRISLTNRRLFHGDMEFVDGSLNSILIGKWRRDYTGDT